MMSRLLNRSSRTPNHLCIVSCWSAGPLPLYLCVDYGEDVCLLCFQLGDTLGEGE